MLAALADKFAGADGDGRFSFHALMSQRAREKIAQNGGDRARHANDFVRRSNAASWSAQQTELELIEGSARDYRVAGDAEAPDQGAETMALALTRFLVVKGRLAEGIKSIEQALQSVPSAPPMTVANLHHALGTLQYRHGDLVLADETLQRALK